LIKLCLVVILQVLSLFLSSCVILRESSLMCHEARNSCHIIGELSDCAVEEQRKLDMLLALLHLGPLRSYKQTFLISNNPQWDMTKNCSVWCWILVCQPTQKSTITVDCNQEPMLFFYIVGFWSKPTAKNEVLVFFECNCQISKVYHPFYHKLKFALCIGLFI
jgi:hypothetical protein